MIDTETTSSYEHAPIKRNTRRPTSIGSGSGQGGSSRGLRGGIVGLTAAAIVTGGAIYNSMDNSENQRVHGDEDRVVESLKRGENVGVLNRVVTVNSGATIRFTVGEINTQADIASYNNYDSKVPNGSRLVIKNPIMASDEAGKTWYGFTAVNTSANGDVANSLKWVSADLEHQKNGTKPYMEVFTPFGPPEETDPEQREAVLQGDHLVDSEDGSRVAESLMISDNTFKFMADLALKETS